MENVLGLIKDLGFPVAVCVFLAYYVKSMTDQFRQDVKDMTDKYNQAIKENSAQYSLVIEKFIKSNDKTAKVLTSLESKLGLKGDEE